MTTLADMLEATLASWTPVTGRALTFEDTFRLPATGDDIWAIRDSRTPAPAAGAAIRILPPATATAYVAVSRDPRPTLLAVYHPDRGWESHVGDEVELFDVLTQLEQLDVDLPEAPPLETAYLGNLLGAIPA